jgi:hypothetical protein
MQPNDPSADPSVTASVPPRDPLGIPPLPVEGSTAGGPNPNGPNTWGIVAFACSFAGFCLPVVVSVPVLIVACIAAWRAPRGFAIAAIVLSLLQIAASVAFLLWAVSMVTPAVRTMAQAEMAMLQAESLERDTGVASFPIDGASRLTGDDAWGTAFRVEVIELDGDRTIYVWSAGPDAAFDTEDDFVATSRPEGAAQRDGKPVAPDVAFD